MQKTFLLSTALLMIGLFFPAYSYAVDPIAHWRFDEGVGTSATDSSGNGNTGTISGATYTATVPPAVDFVDPFSLEFDGVDDGVTTPLSVDNFSQFTISGWAYPRTAAADEGWFGANDVFEFLFVDPTTLRCWTAAGSVNWSFEGDDDFLNNWHHITCLGNGNAVILYVDGDEVASSTHSFTNNYGSGGDNFSIGLGVQDGGNSGPFDGFIDDVRVYNVALTPQEMQTLGTGSDEPLNNPVISSLTPADNALDVALDASLLLEFNMNVGWESGDILIKRVEDGTIFETIPTGGGPVFGSGTDTLGINPYNDFEYDTEYYVEVPNTAVRDIVDSLYFGGITGTTTWSFRTEEDEVAPVISESVDLPDLVPRNHDGIYYFQTNEVCDISITATSSDKGVVEVEAQPADSVGEDIGITLDGMKAGGTYSFSFSCVDSNGNESNTLVVGPFTLAEERRSSGVGTSVTGRVKSLTENGNTSLANELIAKFPHLFPSINTTTIKTPVSTSLITREVRDLFFGLSGEDVTALQTLLITQGHAIPAGATGYFGSQTEAALRAYQTTHGIFPAVGYFGSITRAQIKSATVSGLWW